MTETIVSTSFTTDSSLYVTKTIGTSPNNSKTGADTFGGTPLFAYLNFETYQDNSGAGTDDLSLITGSAASVFTSSFVEGYDHAKTPMITSGFLDANKTTTDLFKLPSYLDSKIYPSKFFLTVLSVDNTKPFKFSNLDVFR